MIKSAEFDAQFINIQDTFHGWYIFLNPSLTLSNMAQISWSPIWVTKNPR